MQFTKRRIFSSFYSPFDVCELNYSLKNASIAKQVAFFQYFDVLPAYFKVKIINIVLSINY